MKELFVEDEMEVTFHIVPDSRVMLFIQTAMINGCRVKMMRNFDQFMET